MPTKTRKDSLKKEKAFNVKTIKKSPSLKNYDEQKLNGGKNVMKETEGKLSTTDSKKSFSLRLNPKALKYGLPLIVLLILGGLMYYFKGQFIPVVVNGTPIFRGTLISELEKKSGKETLDNLVIETLILQEAKKQKVVVSDEEINTEVSKVEKSITDSGSTLIEALKTEKMTLEDFQKQIKLQKIVEKIVLTTIIVSDEEVKTYMDINKLTLPEGTTAEEFQQQTKDSLLQQKKSEAVNKWITDLQSNGKIQYFLQFPS